MVILGLKTCWCLCMSLPTLLRCASFMPLCWSRLALTCPSQLSVNLFTKTLYVCKSWKYRFFF